jgi:hypothetical protein
MIDAYLVDDVALVRETHDDWNRITGAAVTPQKGKIIHKIRRVTSFKGEEVVSAETVMLEDQEIFASDKIRIGAHDRAILGVGRPTDFSWGFIEVYL